MANEPILPGDNINYMNKIVEHPKHGIAEVIAKKKNELTLLLADKKTEVKVDKSSVTLVKGAKEDNEYTKFLEYAPEDIRKMFNTFSDEDKKKYTKVAEFSPEARKFLIETKMKNGLTQRVFWKFNNKVTFPDDMLKPGYLEKHSGQYFASKQAREDLTTKKEGDEVIDLGITAARFQAFVKNMPAGDYEKLDRGCAAKLQAFISLGGIFSGRVQQTIVNDLTEYRKLPATIEDLFLHRDDSGIDRTLVCGYLALKGSDQGGRSRVLSAVKDKDEKPGYDHYTMPNGFTRQDTKDPDPKHGIVLENDLLPFVILAEKPIAWYINDSGQIVDKEGNPL